MRTRWKLLIGVAVVLAALLALNTAVLNQQTKAAEVSVEGAEIISLPGGDVQVLDQPAPAGATGAPIVLIHCYACSLRWWDELAPILSRNHRVIRIDLLGHGGSEKPASGYGMPDQAALVAGALSELGVEGSVVVGQSLGSGVAVALAEQSSQLVDRVVNMSLGPTGEGDSFSLLARISYVPVLGQAMYRLTPDFMVRSGFGQAFAPGFETTDAFGDVIVDGLRAMTYTSYDEAGAALDDYRDEEPLDTRISSAAVPLMVILGTEDQIVDPEVAEEGWSDVPGVRIELLEGIGHTPQIEAPERSAELIERFAADVPAAVAGEAERRSRSGGRRPSPGREGER